ncbi:hypothetical protein FACS1894218_3260 [Bacilli bacterium]|nr:hypothetical protein FACS1894218_3260 [Bacilli bacterium]
MSRKLVKDRTVPIKYYVVLLICSISLALFQLVSFILNHVNMMPYIYEAISYTFILISSGVGAGILIVMLVVYRHIHIEVRKIDIGVCVAMLFIFFFALLYYLTLFGVTIKFMASIMGVVVNIILLAVSMLCLGFVIAIYIVNDKIIHGVKH